MGEMMKGKKGTRAGLLAVLVALLVVVPASGAMAKSLQLQVKEVTVANGSPGDTSLAIDECQLFSEGTVQNNSTGKVKLVATKNAVDTCEGGKSAEGVVTESSWSASGKMGLKGKITITETTEAGTCVYLFSKFKSTFEIPGNTLGFGETTGKRNKKLSAPACPTTSTVFWIGGGTPEPFGEAFEARI
jgi:hypothetical protein